MPLRATLVRAREAVLRAARRRAAFACLAALAAGFATTAAMARDRHAIRAALAKVVELRDPKAAAALRSPPGKLAEATGLEWRWDDPADLEDFAREVAGEPFASQALPDEGALAALAAHLHSYGEENRPPDAVIQGADTEDPFALRDMIASGVRLECHSQSIVAVSLARSLGWQARLVNLDAADGMGGEGHTVAEIWLPGRSGRAGRWAMIDPLYGLIFRDGRTGRLLSVEKIRAALWSAGMPEAAPLGGDAPEAVVEFLPGAPRHRSASERAEIYRTASANLSYFLNNAFAATAARPYGPLSRTPAKRWLDRAPREVRRGVSRALGVSGQRAHPAADSVATPYRAGAWRLALAGAGLLAAAGALGLLALVASEWRSATRRLRDAERGAAG